MLLEQATTVRAQWSNTCDSVVRNKPKFIQRTRDKMLLSSLDTMLTLLEGYTFTAKRFTEADGSITLSLNEIDIIENAKDEKTAKKLLGKAVLEYAMDYYNEYELYSNSPNRKGHIPYVFKALIIDDADRIGEIVTCHDGEN